MTQRGRPRKHRWLSFKDLEEEFSLDAQYLKWSSANNYALQTVAATGCPKCHNKDFELRHDRKFKIIRFHCFECRHETSYRIKTPKPSGLQIIPVFKNGVQVGVSIVDHYHPATRRQRNDTIVLKISRGIETSRKSLGGEWYVDEITGGAHNQKRFYANFKEIMLVCSWNRMQAEHEKRLRELEADNIV